MITEQALNYIHKIQTTQTPQALYNMYKVPIRPQRYNPQLHPMYTPRTKHLKSSIFFKYSIIYANQPDQLRLPHITKFKNQIKKYIDLNFNPHTLPQSQHESETDSESD